MKIAVISTSEDFLQEKSAWQQLSAQLANPFADFFVYQTWINIFLTPNSRRSLYILKLSDSELGSQVNKLIGYAPFYRQGKKIGWLGEGRVNYLDLICTESAKQLLWPEILTFLRNQNLNSIYLKNVNSSSATALQLIQHNFTALNPQPCPFLEINPAQAWSEFYNSVLKNKRRYEVRKSQEALESLGEFKILHKFRTEITAGDIEESLALYKKRWQQSYRTKLLKEAYFEYQRNLLKNVESAVLSLAYLNGRLISFIFGFYQNNIFTDYFVAHDPEFTDISVGNLHISKLIEELHRRSCRKFDFSIGEDIYKRKWAKAETLNQDFYRGNVMRLFAIKGLAILKIILKKMLKY